MEAIATILKNTVRQRVSDGKWLSIVPDCEALLMVVLPQLGDFDSMEYAWWLQRANLPAGMAMRAVGIGDRRSGQKFCEYTGFKPEWLFVDATGKLHQELGLYGGLNLKLPFLTENQRAWVNLMLMCAGIGSRGTLAEVLRGYSGDRKAQPLLGNEEEIRAFPLPPLKGKFFGKPTHLRPLELATLRLRNMAEVLANWSIYVPNAAYLTQRGGTFILSKSGEILYSHIDQGILGFAANMSNPLEFLANLPQSSLQSG